MDAKSIGLIVALIAAAVSAFLFGKKSSDQQTIIENGLPSPDALAPTSRDIEREAMERTTLNPPTTIWDEIDRYRTTREETATVLPVFDKPPTTPTRDDSETAAKTYIADPDVARVVSNSCPVRNWEVDYFNKTTRQWDKVYVQAVVSSEAIKAAKAAIGDNGAMFSADAV